MEKWNKKGLNFNKEMPGMVKESQIEYADKKLDDLVKNYNIYIRKAV